MEAAGSWRPADPGPLGLTGLATTTFVWSIFNANLVSGADEGAVLGLALAYGGIAQLLAGMWEFRAGNTFNAVMFSSFGAFWISFFVLVVVGVPAVNAQNGVVPNAFSVYLYAWAIFTTYMAVASLRTTAVTALMFILLALMFWLLAVGDASLAGTHNTTNGTFRIGGYLGLAASAVAWYGSFAAVVNSTFGRTVVPTVPLHLVPHHRTGHAAHPEPPSGY